MSSVAYAVYNRFYPCQVSDLGEQKYELCLAPFNAVEAEKARQLLESEYRTSDVRVVSNRRLEFVAGADR